MTTTILSKGTIGLLCQAVAGHLETASASTSTTATRLTAAYDFVPHRATAPSLVSLESGVGGFAQVVTRALLEREAKQNGMGGYFTLTHAAEAVDYVRNVAKKGPAALRKESWEAVDRMPRIIGEAFSRPACATDPVTSDLLISFTRIAHPDGSSMDQFAAAFFADHTPFSNIIHSMLGPNIGSVTTSISLQFFKRIPANTPFLYMVSDMPAEDVPVDVVANESSTSEETEAITRGAKGKQIGSVCYHEAKLWTPEGHLVGFQRQTRLVTGPEMPPQWRKQLQALWGKGKI
ncbi:hypothetical protein HDU93_004884 [Gonapodya sp. JEL0774]|nr:hypothetical protein HDU93_004884 [Gonapodya sp. JEL0774]